MIRAIRDIRFYLLLSVPLVLYSCCQLLFGICAAKKIVVKADPVFTPCFSEEVQNNLNPEFYPQKLVQQTTHLWPSVDSAVARLRANKTNTLYLSATPLLCNINDQFVLLETGAVVPAHYYDEAVVKNLIRITMPTFHNESTLPRLQKLVSKNDHTLFDSFALSYHHRNWVQFDHKETAYFSIVCTDGQQLNQKIIDHCLHVKNQLEKKGKLHAGNSWIADVRFENQIVVYTKLRGVQHG